MGKVFRVVICHVLLKEKTKFIMKKKNTDSKSRGNRNTHTESIGFHNQNLVRILPFGSQTKIPGK